MQVTINDTVHEVPFDLSVISLTKYVEYYERYGRDLDKQLEQLLHKEYAGDAIDVELLRQIDIDNHVDNEAMAWFTFWTGVDLFEAKNTPIIQPLLNEYRVLRFVMKESLNQVFELSAEIEWNGEIWSIQDFKVNPASEMNFNEIITSKELMRQIYSIGKGHWDALPYLCAIFFRKKSEPFTDELIQEGGDRMELIKELPMNYALQVAFFLTGSVSIWSSTLVSSEPNEAEILNLN